MRLDKYRKYTLYYKNEWYFCDLSNNINQLDYFSEYLYHNLKLQEYLVFLPDKRRHTFKTYSIYYICG